MPPTDVALVCGMVDITTPAFARRFGALVRERRLATGDSIRSIARASHGALGVGLLRQIEAGEVTLDHELVSAVASHYGADLGAILPERLAVQIGPHGVITSGPASRAFRPDDEVSLLDAYLDLVRGLRRQRDSMIVLRRDDVEVLAGHLRMSAAEVAERLLALMGSSRTQRNAVMALLATGAMVIGLASSVAAAPGAGGDDDDRGVVTTDVPADALPVDVGGLVVDDVLAGGGVVAPPTTGPAPGGGVAVLARPLPLADQRDDLWAPPLVPDTASASTAGGADPGGAAPSVPPANGVPGSTSATPTVPVTSAPAPPPEPPVLTDPGDGGQGAPEPVLIPVATEPPEQATGGPPMPGG